MAYTVPDFDAVNFDFSGSYVKPSFDAVDFNFTVGIRTATSFLGAAYTTAGIGIQRSIIGSSWDTDGIGIQRSITGCSWDSIGVTRARGRFGSAWATDSQPSFRSSLSASWSTSALGSGVSQFGCSWQVIPVGSGRSPFACVYGVVPVGTGRHAFSAAWVTSGILSALAATGASWQTFTYSQTLSEFWLFWKDRMFVDNEIIIVQRYGVSNEDELTGVFLQGVEQQCELTSAMREPVTAECVLDSQNAGITAECDISAPIYTDVNAECAIDSMLLADVNAECEITGIITDTDTIRAELEIVCPMLAAAIPLNYSAPYITLNGEQLALIGASVSDDEGQFGWTAQMQLADINDYPKFTSEVRFTLTLGGEVYALILDGKQKPRASQVDKQATISGISTCASFASPRARNLTKTWTDDITATALATELFPGETIEWDILDWTITAPRLAAENESPFDILARVVHTPGAVVEANKDGTIYVRYQYPKSTQLYDTTPDQEFSDADHNFSIDEGIQLATLVNKIRIMDVATQGFADRIEFIPNTTDGSRGKLRVWPSPWRDTFNLRHTSLPIVSAALIGVVVEEQPVETVEVLRSKGSVSKPIHTIEDFAFLYDDLGGLVFDSDTAEFTTTSTTKFESLVAITYTTRFFEYDAVAFIGAKVQFLVEEPDNV